VIVSDYLINKMRRKIVPEVVAEQTLANLPAQASVADAALMMADRGVSSVVVGQHSRLEGIFTVRDLARRVVAVGLDPKTTRLADVMTTNPETIAPDELPIRALRRMQDGGFRHLPIVDSGKVVGVVSRRDFFPEESALLDEETHLWEHLR
jgi:CBS domain-containing protein